VNAEHTALTIFVAIQALGAMPEIPEVRGPWTWLLRWIHDAAQAIARNKDKIL
jgi:hypothetical protein